MFSLTVFSYSLLAGIIPSLIWLVFWLREDSAHPEPRALIIASFAGGLIAVFGAVAAEKYVADIVSDISVRYTIWAAIEEIFKLAAISVIALNSSYNDEPIDAMIYMITIALGFAAIENALFILEPFARGEIYQGIATQSMRFVGATLVHIVSSALIGFSLGYTYYKKTVTKIIALTFGILAAITLHSIFNLSIINASPVDTLKVFAWIWVSVVIMLILFEEIKAVKPKIIIKKTYVK